MKIIIVVLAILATGAITACTKGGKLESIKGNQYTITSIASSKQLVPAIDTTSTGTFTGLYDAQANILTYTITWDDLWRDTKKDTITSINFYGPATATVNGALIRSSPFVSTNKTGSINLGLAGISGFSEAEKNNLLSGGNYFTVNTKRFPAGIIRGQLTVSKL